jgi:hypothetical protein
MSEEDVGLPEETAAILDQENAVPVEAVGPYYKTEIGTTRQIFENIDDLYDYGTDIIYGRGSKARNATTLFIVVDNTDNGIDLLYPNQPHYWIAERLAPSPEYVGDDEDFRGDVFFLPFYEKMVEWAEEGRRGFPPPRGSITAGSYKGVTVYLPDPLLDYSRPESQTGDTTGETTGTTVSTTTTVTPSTSGVTESTTTPGTLSSRFDTVGATPAAATSGTLSSRFDTVGATPSNATPSNATDPDATDPRGRDQRNTPPAAVTGGRGNGAAEVAQRQADSAAARLSAADVTTGTDPCLPQNAGSGSGSTPPASVPYPDAILRQARAAAAAPASVIPSVTGGRGNGAAEVAQRQADADSTATAPTTVTQPPAAQSNASSSSPTPRPPSVYIYEPLTIGFDRYDFNTGKKVYTPNSGPSRNSSSQSMTPPAGPSNVSSAAAIDGGIAVGTTTGGPSLLRQRREAAALSGGAG